MPQDAAGRHSFQSFTPTLSLYAPAVPEIRASSSQMAEGIDNAKTVGVFVTKRYIDKVMATPPAPSREYLSSKGSLSESTLEPSRPWIRRCP